ncbi:organomercurial lyase [Nonomuraea sp. SBT364]|uniref:organomercurial lyase n=1 Tax=Nonomuraea sp. SBT364 TaxID=1580530 RepID=UPI00066D63F3|nr:organomercurial lyase [Nonomuraea sp. SBT364]
MTTNESGPHRSRPDEDVRVAVYAGFARTGRAPGAGELAGATGVTPGEVRRALARLHAARALVLDGDGDGDGAIVMAHPFSSVPLGFSVMGRETLWWGGCAWDAFAVPHLLEDEPEVLVATRCPGCGAPHAWSVGRAAPPPGDQVAHFLVPVAHMWDDVVRTCSHQRLFCSAGCVDGWLARTGLPRGYVMDVPTLWRLARGWYDGRLAHGYTRREPAGAAAHFAGAGLDGPFWGL